MKWFILGMTQGHSEALVNWGVLPKQSVVRMADAKFFAELVHGLLFGVTTTTKAALDSMYRKNDGKEDDITEGTTIRMAVDEAMNDLLKWTGIQETSLMRTHVFYSLVLASILVKKQWPTLVGITDTPLPRTYSPNAEKALLDLAAAIDEPSNYPEYKPFTDASSEKTNVKAQRETRIQWLATALGQGKAIKV
jgi:hypothetical protein